MLICYGLNMGDSVWQAVSDGAAVQWRVSQADGTASEVVEGPTALVYWKPVTWQALQDIHLSRISYSSPNAPKWHQEDPPSAAQVAHAWSSALEGLLATSVTQTKYDDDRDHSGVDWEVYAADHLKRRDREDPADFYLRVAEVYIRELVTSGTPTRNIAVLAGVKHGTAARWVAIARDRGLLPSTTQGRARS